VSQTRVPCHCNKCGLAFAVVYEIDKPGPLTWSTVACPRRTCKSVVRFPIPQNASFTVDAPVGAIAAPAPGVPPAPATPAAPASPPAEAVPWTVAEEREGAPEKSESQACASCGHSFTLRYKYLDADAETVIWVQCPNCGASLQVWVLEGAHDIQL
jgi:hypothetical protein